MTTREEVLFQYEMVSPDGLTDSDLYYWVPNIHPSTLGGCRSRLVKDGILHKIAEVPNERGHTCGVYALCTDRECP